MKYNTLSEAFTATENKALKEYGLKIEMPCVYGGISYGETRHFHVEPLNKRIRKNSKLWQVTVIRDDLGAYEINDYYL